MRNILLIIALAVLGNSFSQSKTFRARFEMGIFGGGSYYIGDLNRTKHFVYSKPAIGAIVRYNLTSRASLRFTATYGQVWGSDSKADDPLQVNRNLAFTSKVYEIAAGFEVDLFKYRINDMKYPVSPYFFYEIAYLRMDPRTQFDGNDIALQALGTEGQGTSLSSKRRYNLNQISLPVGIGIKMNLKERLAISIEYGIRKTFTDYLDDVSGDYVNPDLLRVENGPIAGSLSNPSLDGADRTGFNRGDSSSKDWYAFYGLMITFKPFKRSMCEFGRAAF